ncbi:MAG: tol-pal system protein YbgF [Gammaproteobacteria bacterium]|nr:tol-pal system protein YbgF [Gammaproteobacteria bacterium]
MEPEQKSGNYLLMLNSRVFSCAAIFYLFSLTAMAQAPVEGESAPQQSAEQRLERLERILQSQGLLDMLQQVDQLQQQVNMLRGAIETQNFNLEQLTKRQRDLYTDVDQRMQRLEQGVAIPEMATEGVTVEIVDGEPPLETLTPVASISGPATSTSESSGALQVEIVQPQEEPPLIVEETNPINEEAAATNADIDPITATEVAPADPVQLQAEYQQAFNLLRQSFYDQAIRAFQEFLVAHPNDRYSDNAQYWLAEAHYVKREFDMALTEYDKVIANFPQSQKVNDALLKRGFTLYELGRMEAAKRQLQDIINKQPGSTVARLADERLKLINSSSAPPPPSTNTGSPLE